MGRKLKKKSLPKKRQQPETKLVSSNEVISKTDTSSDNIVRLKLTTRKGTRIESVPLKKLEKIACKTKLHWKLEDGWLILYGFA